MKIMFDNDVLIDLFTNKINSAEQIQWIVDFAKKSKIPCFMYSGSTQLLYHGIADILYTDDQDESVALKKAAELLDKAKQTFLWWPALSEDSDVFDSDLPEENQLLRAFNRMGENALFVTRNENLLKREDNAVAPEEFLLVYEKQHLSRKIEFCDLSAQLDTFRPQMERAILDVVNSTRYIKGPSVALLENELSEYLDNEVETIACGSGTDALLIAMMALYVRPGDQIIVPDFTFIATAEVISLAGAEPVFCDVDSKTYNLDSSKIESLITDRTVGIVAVSLFGQCADLDEINSIASKHGLWVIEDAAQSFGAVYKGKKSCTITKIATTSFFPAKPLGCYGDGGAIFTSDSNLADKMRIILNHGQSKRYHHSVIGVNGRMDTIQAAVVSVKLKNFDHEIQLRRSVANRYSKLLKGTVEIPVILDHNLSVWAQYTVQHDEREKLRQRLSDAGIPTAVHYPVPLHRQKAFSYLSDNKSTPVTEKVSERVFSLPMHPFLSEESIEYITAEIQKAL